MIVSKVKNNRTNSTRTEADQKHHAPIKRLVIMRGVSGSGKSTRAKEIVKDHLSTYTNSLTIICSADDFFINITSGKYEFNTNLLSKAHAWCLGKCTASMDLNVDLVVIDNTNTRQREFQEYVDLANAYGYEVEFELIGDLDDASLKVYANRNNHNVSLDIIRKQAKRLKEVKTSKSNL